MTFPKSAMVVPSESFVTETGYTTSSVCFESSGVITVIDGFASAAYDHDVSS